MTTLEHLRGNQPADRFYRGGSKIRDFRADDAAAAAGNRVPEDWVGSTTTLFGDGQVGLSRLANGTTLRDAVGQHPQHWLGPEHVAAFGTDTRLLVKLLDAGERLPVHVHPTDAFALDHVGAQHGKAEAWYILEGGTVHLGFTREIEEKELRGWVETQNVAAIMAAMHVIEVNAGDSIYVPPGLPHAIGAGIFLVEVQQPEDLSILLEWQDFAIDGPADGHLGIGFETALQATDIRAWTLGQINELVVRGGANGHTLAASSAEYFRASRVDVTAPTAFDSGFGVLVVLSGKGTLTPSGPGAPRIELSAGDTLLLAYALGSFTLDGELSVLRCQPPVSSAGPASPASSA
ncbi:class I mannose-6-phosphate isomerase [Cryobacterium sp. TMT2-23]|uniref:class I mannose-6-phosphate isomerase n=1 Tax=Cryobacterium sp. TMT2-23 TaxID=1259252 RepID=UPI00106AC5F9|nr:class I mannose-6-phosphate isomerase [Cryobacterium sp. TMT2-23]TFD29122.1 carbohydrate kinase [Cryobacterium sp. TMT2-23]